LLPQPLSPPLFPYTTLFRSRQLFALSEAYPQLRAAENFAQLQASLNQIEDTLQNARRYYNAAVRDFNTRVEQFPSNMVAGMGNLDRKSTRLNSSHVKISYAV